MNGLRRSGLIALALVAMFAATASSCEEKAATPSSMCAIVRGNGRGPNGNDGDRRVHRVVWPNQNPQYNKDREEVRYFPCNSRDYIINPPGIKNANGQEVGDRHTPSEGYTKNGTRVHSWLTAYWTLNQDEPALNQFWELCDKFTCASDSPQSGDTNFSTPGWNGMLGEKFGTTLDGAFFKVIAEFEDDVWRTPNPTRNEQVAKRMSELFAEVIRAKTGYSTDTFCGSGNSGWQDPNKPGEGKFTCTNVRVEINSIFAADARLREGNEQQAQSRQQMEVNAARLADAKALYGDAAGYWLGMQDTIKECRAQQVNCAVHLGDPPGAPAGR